MNFMNRKQVWEHLNEAEMNEAYYGLFSSVCRWFNASMRILLLLASAGSLAAILAKSDHQGWLSWLSFIAALIEVVIKPVLNWEKGGDLAKKWRLGWIDIRQDLLELWRHVESGNDDATVDTTKVMKKIIAIEKAEGYLPKVQFIMDKLSKTAAKRYFLPDRAS